jgi:hypothetical protein
LTSGDVRGPGAKPLTLTPGKAFVLTHAVAGVLRSYSLIDTPPPRADIEDALVELITGFVSGD